MLGSYRVLMIVWTVTALFILINLVTPGSFMGEIVFFLINIGMVMFSISLTSGKLLKH